MIDELMIVPLHEPNPACPKPYLPNEESSLDLHCFLSAVTTPATRRNLS